MKKIFVILAVFGLLLSAGSVLAKEGKLKLGNDDRGDDNRGRSLEDRFWKATTTASTTPKQDKDRERELKREHATGTATTTPRWEREVKREHATGTASTSPWLKVQKLKCPPGHFVARGWIKKNGRPTLVEGCRALPFGIARLLGWRGKVATTTPPVATTTTGTTTP